MGETLSHTAKAQAVLPSRGRSVGLHRSGPQLYCAFRSAIDNEDGWMSAASPR